MIFNVVSPMVINIDGDSLKDAIKNFIKINHNLNITNMIIKDQSKNIEARIQYYQQDGRNKVGINMFPINSNYLPIATNTYVPTNMRVPHGVMPFIPTVVNIPIN
jgi:hypothetical protein